MSYVRAAAAGAALVAAFVWGGIALIVALLITAYACLVGVVLYSIREHGPADPPPVRVTQLRQRQVTEYCCGREVRR